MANFSTQEQWNEWIDEQTSDMNRHGETRRFLHLVKPTQAVKLVGFDNPTFLVGRTVQGNPSYHLAVIELSHDTAQSAWTHTFQDIILPNPSLSGVGETDFIDNEFTLTVSGSIHLRNSGRYKATYMVTQSFEFMAVSGTWKSEDVRLKAVRTLDMKYNRNVWTCDGCGTVCHDSDSSVEYEGDTLCSDCSGSIITCDGCNTTVIQNNDALRAVNCCDDCADELVRCYSCTGLHWTANITEVQGNGVCSACLSSEYRTCSTCGELVHRREVSGGRCRDCRPLSGYGNTQALEFQGGSTPTREEGRDYYGVELEIEVPYNDSCEDIAVAMRRVNQTLEFKHDGSLNHGFEIVSQPATLQHHTSPHGVNWREVLRIARSNSCQSHNVRTCGLHVHVGRDSLDPDTEIKLAYFVNMFEDFITKFARRNYNSYANKRNKVLDETARQSHGRYDCLNLSSEQTVEFRIFKGTLKESSFMATIEFVDALINFCRVHTLATFRDERAGVQKFIGYTERKVRKYPHLYSYICERGIDTHYGYLSLGRQEAEIQPDEVGVTY